MKKMSGSTECSRSRGTRFLFVFFPEIETTAVNPSATVTRKKSNHPCPHLFSKLRSSTAAQSTISICALLICITLLLFTLSSFEPTSASSPASRVRSRKLISSSFWVSTSPKHSPEHALQGMGTLHRRGTRAMNELVVAHAVESLTPRELRLFLRLLFRSGLSSKSDLLLIFPPNYSGSFERTVLEENESFLKLVQDSAKDGNLTGFDSAQFMISAKKERESGEPIWGRKTKSNSSSSEEEESESTRLSYGSVVSFDADELDPENSLARFLHTVPMGLRRWSCYPLLLGRLRKSFKHLILVDAKEILLLGDPLSRLKNRSSDSVYVPATLAQPAPARKIPDRTQPSGQKPVSPKIVMGGSRGVRRLSNAVLTEIVQETMLRKKKSSVTESGLFNQLIGNEFLVKSIKLIVLTESIPELSSLTGLSSEVVSSSLLAKISVVRRSSNVDSIALIRKQLCPFSSKSANYNDC
ncbi:unnamed protein product [Cuscuta europaea]|uniref:DUF7780 domain-containing protein n=1 Tax=Cuscuta europaea TaxID=41803 RepID=A0A9P1DYS6_CUSEU|nr:unnamed protein product [Cuscuta europaea]